MAIVVSYQVETTEPQFTVDNASSGSSDVLALAGGGFVSAFTSLDNDFKWNSLLKFYDSNLDLIVARAPAAGATAGIGVKVSQLANGNVVAVWDEEDGGAPGLKAAIYDASGNVVRAEFDVSTVMAGHEHPSVTALANGNFVVAGAFSGGGISFRTYDPTGVLVGAANNTIDAAGDYYAQALALGGGGFVTAWYDLTSGLVRGRLYDPVGAPLGAAFDLGNPGAGGSFGAGASLAATGDGGFAMVHRDPQWSGAGVSLTFWSAAGANTTPGGVIRVDQSNGVGETWPDVTVTADGHVLVTWTRADHDIYGRIFDQAGAPMTGEFMVSNAGSSDSFANVSDFGDGRLLVNWTTNPDPVNDPYGNSVQGKVIELVRTVTGDIAADTYAATDALRDSLSGQGGADSLSGGAGTDTLNGGAAADLLEGGADSDLLLGGEGRDKLYAATRAAPEANASPDTLRGEGGDDDIYGAAGGDSAEGGDGDDRLFGGGGADLLKGGLGEDRVVGGDGADTLTGGLDRDTLQGGDGDDLIYAMEQLDPAGSAIGDVASGGNDADIIVGSAGADELLGDRARDTLTGGLGADTLDGGSAGDRFLYLAAGESPLAAPDLILGLAGADKIDLSAIDANPVEAGDQKFKLVAAFDGQAGQLVVAYHPGGPWAGMTTIQGDVNGDGSADFLILASGDHHGFDNFAL